MDFEMTPTDFVAVLNQTLEFAYPSVAIVGELANFRVSKNKWVYFDLKDETASVKFFGTIYNLPGPLEDGLLLRVNGQPRLSPQYGFSVTVHQMMPVGEGSLKKAANLLAAKLEKEGLFDIERKRPLPYPPTHIGLITSKESAAYADFNKVLNARWGGIKISYVDVQVQGEQAVNDIVHALDLLNQHGSPPEIIVVTRGGGSADDLAAFNTEQVTRAVAASRIPTLVAIGHEIDISLAELAADKRASTPSNAAELLVPDKKAVLERLQAARHDQQKAMFALFAAQRKSLNEASQRLMEAVRTILKRNEQALQAQKELHAALNPQNALKKGYALIRSGTAVIRSSASLKPGQNITISFEDGSAQATVNEVHPVVSLREQS